MKNPKVYEEELQHYGVSIGEIRHEVIYSAYVSLVIASPIDAMLFLEKDRQAHYWSWGGQMSLLSDFFDIRQNIAYEEFVAAYEQEEGRMIGIIERLMAKYLEVHLYKTPTKATLPTFSLGDVRYSATYVAYVLLVEADIIHTLRYLIAEVRRNKWDWDEVVDILLGFLAVRPQVRYVKFSAAYQQHQGNALEVMRELG